MQQTPYNGHFENSCAYTEDQNRNQQLPHHTFKIVRDSESHKLDMFSVHIIQIQMVRVTTPNCIGGM